jgi:YVTN family beta-propeller protein
VTTRRPPFSTILASLAGAALAACGGSTPSQAPCPAGQTCTSDVYVACFATDEVKGRTRDLQPSGIDRTVGDGPIALALSSDTLWVSASLAPEVDEIAAGGAPVKAVLAGGDLEHLRVHQGRVYVSNSQVSTITVLDAATRQVVDEVSVVDSPGQFSNPRGLDFVGTRAYVALPGTSAADAAIQPGQQEVAVIDFSGAGTIVNRISMGVPGAFDAQALPFPFGVLAAGTKAFVALANLKLSAPDPRFGQNYTVPAGSGRLAVIDSAAGDAVSIVDLGAGCQNPGGLALEGSTLWVACGSGAVLPVAIGGLAPVVGAPIATPAGIVPGNVAVCRGIGYVTDQFSGAVVRFDSTAKSILGSTTVCPVDPVSQFAFAADVACVP